MTALLIGHWRLALGLVVTLVLAAYVQFLRVEVDHYRDKYETEHAAFVAFKEKTRIAGEEAKRRAKAQEAADKERKEKADAENAAALATLAGAVGRLRDERDRAIGRFVSAAAPCSSGAAGADRTAQYERAYRALVSGVRTVGLEGDQRIVKFNTAKRWAHAPGQEGQGR